MKNIIRFLAGLLLSITLLGSCKKEEDNQPPICEITSPNFGDEFIQGDIVTISVDASDPDGSIKEVRFYIDDIGKFSSSNFPYGYEWDTKDANDGSHTIKVLVIDDGNLQTEKSTEVKIQGKEGTFTDSRDNNTYKWIKIGNQIWMAENLAYLPSVSPPSAVSESSPYYYVYGYNGSSTNEAKATDNYKKYGVLYNWKASKVACPAGWHLPTDDEWKQLEMFIGMSKFEADKEGWRGTDEGNKLKAISGWMINDNSTDNLGFSALPGGIWYSNNRSLYNIGDVGYWWSATEVGGPDAWYRYMMSSTGKVGRSVSSKEDGISIRCIRD